MNGIHPLWLVAVSAGLGFIPLVIGLATSYAKLSVVFGMLRNGLGTQQVPSGLIIMALSVALSLFVMAPLCQKIVQRAEQQTIPELTKAPTETLLQLMSTILEPWRDFLFEHAGKNEMSMLLGIEHDAQAHVSTDPHNDTTNLRIVLTAFILTELKEAFAMGFVLLLPFLVIDLVVANILAGMGMYMVSPAMISLPLKLLLFVAADGWIVLTKSLIISYR